MTKKFFTKASPKAAAGIRRVFESKGYEVHAELQTDGTVTVVAVKGETRDLPSGKFLGRKRGRQIEGVAA